MSTEAPPAPPKPDLRPPTAKADVAEFMQKMRAKNPPTEQPKAPAEPAKPTPVAAKPPEPPATPAPAPVTTLVKPTEPKSLVPEIPAEPLVKAPEPPSLEEAKRLKRSDYAALEAARDDFKTKWETSSKTLSELQKKLEEASSRTAPELEEYKKKLAEKEQYIQQHMLSQTEEFQRAFDRPIAQTIQDAKDAIGGERGEKLAKILKAPDDEWRAARIKEFVAELEDDYDRGTVRTAANELRKLERNRREELDKAAPNIEALKQLKHQEAEQRAAQMKQQRERLYAASLAEASRALPEFIEGDDPSHNAQVVENRLLLQDMINNELSPQEFGRMAAWAVRGHRSLAREKAMGEEIAKLRGEISKLTAANPSMDSGMAASGDPNGKMPQNRTELLNWASKRMVGGSARKPSE